MLQFSPSKISFWIFVLLATLASPLFSQDSEATKATIRIKTNKRSYEGKLLAYDNSAMVILRRNGRMTNIPKKRIEAAKTISGTFKPMNSDDLRTQLVKEFGEKYQVSVTNHFVVVHPPGDFQVWAMPFEKLFIRYNSFFASRNVSLDKPEFPMVAVVLDSRGEFDRFLERYHEADQNILGYYSPKSNRIITYDQTEGKAKDQDWFFTVDTVVHEATHQSAFNTGLHSRFAPNPRWISEGLATMFEAPGVQNSMYYSKQKDRINFGRLTDLRTLYEKEQVTHEVIANMIASDDIFRTSPGGAYALAWGLTFYLSETQPDRYAAFLRADSAREDFVEFTSRERLEAFMRKFGKISEIAPRMEAFYKTLPESKTVAKR